MDLGECGELVGEVFCGWGWGRFRDLFGGRMGFTAFGWTRLGVGGIIFLLALTTISDLREESYFVG